MKACVLLFLTVGMAVCGSSRPAETYFADVNSEVDIVFSLQNAGYDPSDVAIDRYFPDGTIMDSANVSVPGHTVTQARLTAHALPFADHKTMDVLVDGQPLKVLDHQRSWIRITGNVIVSATIEQVIGDVLHQVKLNSENPRSGHLKSDKVDKSGEYAFVNLSGYPVFLSACQEVVWTGSCAPSVNTFVASNAMVVYPAQQGYIVLKVSTDVTYLTGKMFYTAGSTKTFGSDTSITFDRVN